MEYKPIIKRLQSIHGGTKNDGAEKLKNRLN